MLDKEDIKTIKNIVTDSLGEFFEKALAPYLDQLTKRHDQHDNDFDTVFRKQEKLDDYLVDHEKRIKKLETSLNS